MWEAIVPPEAGAPSHTHAREDEAFFALSGDLLIEFEGGAMPRCVGLGGFFFGARGRRHAFRDVGDQPARVPILCAPSCGLGQMFAELDAVTAAGVPEIEKLVNIAATYGVMIKPPAH